MHPVTIKDEGLTVVWDPGVQTEFECVQLFRLRYSKISQTKRAR